MPKLLEQSMGPAQFMQGDIVREFLPKVTIEGFDYQTAVVVMAAPITAGRICTFFSGLFGCKKPPTRNPTTCEPDPRP